MFEMPKMEMVEFEVEEIMTASGTTAPTSSTRPGGIELPSITM